jgi:NAD(P)-dependent dehydrogenase (short-subunit alcohol dehydrogenase family)
MKGKVVLVTGANGGLGTHVTQAFLDAGATVVGTSRRIQPSDFDNPNFTALPAEISTREGAQTLVDQVVACFGKLDALAHTVGGFAGGQSVADLVVWLTSEAGKDVNGSVIPVHGKDA